MPRPAGEAAKLGDFYEAIWTVDAVLDVFEGRFQSITVEAFGEESVGVEFHLETNEGALQFHSVKRQKQDGNWSIAKLCQKDEKTGRSILGDLLTKQNKWPSAQTRFVSATGANELRELEERAETPTNVDEFRGILSPKLRNDFDSRIVPLFGGDTGSAFKALKTLEVILRTHKELTRSVERRIDRLLNRTDGSELRTDDIRRMIAEFILKNLGPRIDRDRLRTFFREKGIGVQDWKLDVTVNDAVAAANRRYLSETETELINSTQIARDVVERIIDSLNGLESRGVLVVAPGGFGKSCVLAQCLEQLTKSGTPHLCLRMDAFTPCTTAKQLGQQMDLRTSPVVVLAGIADNSPSVLVVDQLDAMSLVSGRNPKMWEVFRDLCDEVRNYPRMKMILACRDFDLEHDHRLRSLGDAKSGFSKFSLNKLTEAEIFASLRVAGYGTLELTPKQLDILAVPFHLLLYLQGNPASGFKTVGELYDQYWTRKRQNLRITLGREPKWNEVVDALTTKMSEQQLLLASMSVTDDWELDAQAMASEHVLIKVQNNRQYRFFHESFFDYAYARRFCAKERNLVELLQSSEQHLFRRAQVRQILEYRREEDFDKYIADVRSVFESPNIRFHIKRMVASSFNRIDQPRSEEWRLLERYVLEGELSRYVSSAIRDHVGWFDSLNSLHVFENWLASSNSLLNDVAIWYLESHRLHDCRSKEIARLIRPYSNREGDWRQRIQRIMSWGQAHKSVEMANIYIELIAQGIYDDYKSSASGGDFWSQHYNAEIESPKFLIDVLATWFDRVVKQFDDGETWNFLDNCTQNRSHTGAMMVGKAAVKEPGYFIEQLLPRVRETVLRTQECRAGEMRNRTWPWLSNDGIPFKIDDAILLWLRKSLQNLAKSDVELFRRYVSTISIYPHQTFGYLLLRSWASNPEEFANDCAEYLIADQRRLNIGYAFYSVTGEGTGESAISRIALKAITPHCSPELLHKLETGIIGYCDEYEKQTPKRRGYSELLLLRSLESSRVSHRATLRIEELERKFPKIQDAIVEEDKNSFACFVGSPITQADAERMTDTQWISAMNKYDGSTDTFRGGPVELSRALTEFARKDRSRFTALVEKMPDDIDSIYFSAILDGLCGGYQNLSNDEKEADTKYIAAFPLEKFLTVIDRLHALPNRPCGSAIVKCIRLLSDRPIPPRVLDIVSYYAIKDPDPGTDIWQDTRDGRNYYGGDPYSHGINCVRGRAAEAISSLLYDDQSRLDALRSALVALSKDPVISVRTCAINAYLPLLNFSGDLGVELFLNACDGCEALCATHTFEHFIHEAIHTHCETLRNILQFALKSSIPEAVQIAARQITLAELQDVPVGTDVHGVISGSEDMRKAAAGVYATNLSQEAVGRICAERLGQFFSDESEEVRREVSAAFFNLPGDLLLQLKEFISRFIESPCFENSPDGLLHAMRNSTVELP
ncbi:MAG: hypothetical protein MUC43_10700, partial [Pirellula sp.]|nr:hypothetical protein [Pirellula sp.]